jgi:ABC-type transporter MlaC component
MKKILLALIYFIFAFKSSLAESCLDAQNDYEKFLNASIGRMINIAKIKVSPEMQEKMMEKLLFECVDIEKVSKRVLGRAKWQELTKEEKDNFLMEYPKYFISNFKDIVLVALNGIESFNTRKLGEGNSHIVSLKYADKSKKDIEIVLEIEEKEGKLKITDGKFAELSIVTSQRQMFDRLYDQNSKVIKEFKAEKYLTKQ